jgi:glucokinase
MLLAGDIGGTKTNLAIYSSNAGLRAPMAEATFPSARYSSLEALVRDFLDGTKHPVTHASFGIAGPVVEGCVKTTNLPWEIDAAQLAHSLNLASVRLLNDLEAIAHAVPALQPEECHTLQAGQPVADGTLAVVAPGTGLGEAFLIHDGSGYRAHASEGGHADFAPSDDLEIGLLCYLKERFGHVSYERVCSGRGLPNIYAYLKDSGNAPEPAWLAERLAGVADPAPIIVQAALDDQRPCALCQATLDLFASILAAEAGNLALKVVATGGVYLGGGIPPRILPFLRSERLAPVFQRKGRLTDLLTRVPVHVILNPKMALLGAATHGLGDRQALLDNKRRVIRFHLGNGVVRGLEQLREALR